MNHDSFDFSSNSDASYRVKIEGRLLDDDDEPEKDQEDEAKQGADVDKMDTDASGQDKGKEIEAKKQSQPRLSHFFKAMTVEFDRTKMRNGAEQSVEWKKPERLPNNTSLPPAADFDELTFKRNGDENFNITINLFRDETPERFELSPELADVVDETVATRAEAVMGVWEYIKLMGLQEDEEKRHFRCDELLKKVSTDPVPMKPNGRLIKRKGCSQRRGRHPRTAELHRQAPPASVPCQTRLHHPGRRRIP